MTYYDKKAASICTYPGCRNPAQEEHCQCAVHAEQHRRRNMQSYLCQSRQLDLSKLGIE